MKKCLTCGTKKESNPTPDGDEICPSCGDREMLDEEDDEDNDPDPTGAEAMWRER